MCGIKLDNPRRQNIRQTVDGGASLLPIFIKSGSLLFHYSKNIRLEQPKRYEPHENGISRTEYRKKSDIFGIIGLTSISICALEGENRVKLLLLEDQASDRNVLLTCLEKYTYQTGYALTALPCAAPKEIPIEKNAFDAALLDIMIDGQPAGVETARALRRRGFRGPMVFLTTSRDYYAEGFEVDAAHYLIKPYTYALFCEAMERLIRQTGRPHRTVELPVGRRRVPLEENEILYVEVYDKETMVYTKREKLRVLLPLREVEALLSGGSFLRCFRSCVVNMEHIVRAEDDAFLLDNGARVPITLRGKEDIKGAYLEYRFERMRRKGDE